MPALLLVLILLGIIAFIGLIGFVGHVIGIVLTLVMAGLVGAAADAIVPGELPYGKLGAVLAGLIGSVLGVLLVGRIGPAIFNVPIVPALIGAVIIAFVVDLIGKSTAGRTTRP
ncbi:MAG: GlsB/YeaQ/YmgE family stress response membrane protein [Chloroflexi bacterium]|nr:GlsB/YeaQ/YmgE family stress response membrane protein [Chloroflexota bacterium]